MQALHTAATGMAAQELSVQVIANNIANLQTTGYKKQTAAFQDLIYEHVRRVGAQSSDQGNILPVGIDIGGGVKTVGTPRSMTQGTLSQTGNDLDIAITGEGFFKIQMPDGTFQYTRDGTFQMDNTGRIVTTQGNPVQPTITIPQNASGLTVNAQGQVSVTLPGSTNTSTIIGQIGLTRFINKGGLQPVGNNLFTDTPSSGPPQDGLATAEGFGTINQGSLEQANVDVVSEMTDLIAAQRAYEMNAKVITAADQMLQATTALFVAAPVTALAQASEETIAVPVLRASVTVESDIVRIGDVIDNAGTAARIAIYRAPDLGTTGSLPTAQVIAALQAHQVIGVDIRDIKAFSVTRLARTLESKEIESQVAHALEHHSGLGDAANLSLTFDRDLQDARLEAWNNGAMQPVSVRYEPRSGRFDVNFEIANDVNSARTRLRYTGIAIETVEATVLTRGVDRGEVLKS